MRTGSVSVDVRDEDDERKKTTKRAIEGQKKTAQSLAGKNAFAPPLAACLVSNKTAR